MTRLRDVDITPRVAKWARRSAGFTIEEAARKIGRSPDEIGAWESGELRPSLAQLRKASEVYKRPLAVFFLPEPPQDFSTLRDFRRLPADVPAKYSPNLRFAVRQTRARQQWLRGLLESEGRPPLAFVGSARLSADPTELAQTIRQTIGVAPDDIRSCRTREDALHLWLSRSEEKGIFVFQAGNLRWEKIDVAEARGFVLCDEYAPFIFLNAQDAKAARVFTLAHELAHLWLNASGVSNLKTVATPTTETEKIEVFCNRVAAEILIPQAAFQVCWEREPKDKTLEERIQSQSKYFKVSEWVVSRRLLDWGRISKATYDTLTQDYDRRWRDVKEREKASHAEGGPSPYLLKLINNGYAFSSMVLGAYQSGDVSGRDAASLLGVKLDKMGNLAELIGVPAPWREGGE